MAKLHFVQVFLGGTKLIMINKNNNGQNYELSSQVHLHHLGL